MQPSVRVMVTTTHMCATPQLLYLDAKTFRNMKLTVSRDLMLRKVH